MTSLNDVTPSIARLECGTKMGTGFLVSPTHLLTAWHVVEQADRQPIQVELPEHDQQGRLTWTEPFTARRIGGRPESEGDFALLELDRPLERDPILLSGRDCQDGQEWNAWGYPASKRTGLTAAGRVAHPVGNVNGVRAIELSCEALKANPPLRLDGFSGAPVLVGGAAVAILLSVLGAGGATVYARDVTTVLADPVCGDVLRDGWWATFHGQVTREVARQLNAHPPLAALILDELRHDEPELQARDISQRLLAQRGEHPFIWLANIVDGIEAADLAAPAATLVRTLLPAMERYREEVVALRAVLTRQDVLATTRATIDVMAALHLAGASEHPLRFSSLPESAGIEIVGQVHIKGLQRSKTAPDDGVAGSTALDDVCDTLHRQLCGPKFRQRVPDRTDPGKIEAALKSLRAVRNRKPLFFISIEAGELNDDLREEVKVLRERLPSLTILVNEPGRGLQEDVDLAPIWSLL